MEINVQTLAYARKMIKADVSDGVLAGLLKNIPDEKMGNLLLPIMAEAIYDMPESASDEQIVNYVMKKINRKAENKKESNPANPKVYTRKYFDNLWIEQRLMGAVLPDTTLELYGEKFTTPIMTAPLSHLKNYGGEADEPMVWYAKAAKNINAVHWVGMCENEEFVQIAETGARIIRIIKPYEDDEKIFQQIHCAEENGALAVGIDIDHTFTDEGKLDVIMNERMENKSLEKMEAYIQSTKLPFVIKGVLSVHDAKACGEIGAGGIMVSHHGGRMNYAVPPLVVLPKIVKAVGEKMPIFMDGGISSGADVYKAMAMGANAVSVGTHLMPLLMQSGANGVSERMREMNMELRGYMANTGVKDVSGFEPTVLHMSCV